MAKREQVVTEVVEQEIEETVRSIAQAQVDYGQLMDESGTIASGLRTRGSRRQS
ncbi:hypothetical protein [Brevibacillus brevis]|uniref:hypothetical protein n=1 Tax=Brevibacillus brevis TaxID=1393 RepID=UPI0025A53CBC|nr:hypothetical protein [Brevibacillus brevis]WJQ81945.1 hypothetical protein QN310_01915 [Brevibacillus brevis]